MGKSYRYNSKDNYHTKKVKTKKKKSKQNQKSSLKRGNYKEFENE